MKKAQKLTRSISIDFAQPELEFTPENFTILLRVEEKHVKKLPTDKDKVAARMESNILGKCSNAYNTDTGLDINVPYKCFYRCTRLF